MNKIEKFKLSWFASYKVKKIRGAILSLFPLNKKTNVFFIFGCQRSGTTIIQKLISLNPKVKFYGEGDFPYFHNEDSVKHHRIKSDAEIKELLELEHLEFITLKPLYESHRANALVSSVPNSKGVWVFRSYLDVIDSHLNYYDQNVKEYVNPLFSKESVSWLNEYISDEIQGFIDQFSISKISDADAYALFWIARNSLYTEVLNNKNILCISYEDLVNNSNTQIKRMCDFLDLPFKSFYSKLIRSNAVSKNVNFTLHSDIESKCKEIYNQLIINSN